MRPAYEEYIGRVEEALHQIAVSLPTQLDNGMLNEGQRRRSLKVLALVREARNESRRVKEDK